MSQPAHTAARRLLPTSCSPSVYRPAPGTSCTSNRRRTWACTLPSRSGWVKRQPESRSVSWRERVRADSSNPPFAARPAAASQGKGGRLGWAIGSRQAMSTLAKARSHPRSPASCLAEPPPRTRVTDGTTGPSVLLDHCAEARPRPCFWCSSRPSRPEPVPPGPRSRLRRGSACRRCPRCAVVDTHAARLAAPASRLSRRGARGLNYRFGHAVEVKAFGERGGRPRTPRRGTMSRQRRRHLWP
jgi:hypothetical protein